MLTERDYYVAKQYRQDEAERAVQRRLAHAERHVLRQTDAAAFGRFDRFLAYLGERLVWIGYRLQMRANALTLSAQIAALVAEQRAQEQPDPCSG